ncbi:MAG: endolytic transglycosylase MltG [Anaerolineales bacterium]|jgi:UPF0755 protein
MKRLKPSLIIFLAAFIIITCLGSMLAGLFIYRFPNMAAQKYGKPTAELNLVERTYLSIFLLASQDDLLIPYNLTGTSQTITIPLGETTLELTNRLEAQGIIRNASAFRNFLYYSGLDKSIQAGEYKLNPSMTGLQIAGVLQDSTPEDIRFSILPGWRLEEIAAALPTSGLNISPESFLQTVKTPPVELGINLGEGNIFSFEGYLFPDFYNFHRETTVVEFISSTSENFLIKVDNGLIEGFNQQGLSIHQAVILASIVQRESILEEEAPIIASVFLNRLSNGIKLESDPTVQYALGYNLEQKTWWTNPLSSDNLLINSPYNTYLYRDLPPGPISNPGLNAIRAVAFPAETSYLYFRAACDGSGRHSFAEIFEEHLANSCE